MGITAKIKTGFRRERIEQEMNSKKLTAQCAVLQELLGGGQRSMGLQRYFYYISG